MSALHSDPILREIFVLWPSYTSLVEYLTRSEAKTASPGDVHGAICAADQHRLAALLYAHMHADTLDEGLELVTELRGMTSQGRRPRFGFECGLTLAAFTEHRPESR